MSYIDVEKALESINLIAEKDGKSFDKDSARYAIQTTEPADVVEVVRCSKCQHWGGVTFGFICRKFSGENTKICMHADDFCSYGERRSENENT